MGVLKVWDGATWRKIGCGDGGTTVTDDFNRANSSTSIGGAWSLTADQNATGTGTPTWGITSNTAYPTGDVIDGSSTRHRPIAYQDVASADVDITVTLATYYASGSNKAGGIALRLASDGSLFLVGQNQVRWLGPTGGAATVFSYTGGDFATGDVMRVVAAGTTISVYKNGTLIGSGTSSNNQTATRHGLIAGALFDANMRFDDFSLTTASAPGRLRLWTGTEWVREACDEFAPGGDYPATVLADSPIAYWKLDETSGTSATDSSGNGHTATYSSSAMTTGGVAAPGGLGGTAALFGSGDYAITGSDAAFSPTTLTLEAIVRLDSGGQSALISHDVVTTSIETDNAYNLYIETNGATAESNNAFPFINGGPGCTFTGRWAHVALTHDPGRTGKSRLFLNGVLVATADLPVFETGTRPLLLGRRGYTPSPEALNGPMCHAAVYGTALSDADIAAHFAATGMQADVCAVAAHPLKIEDPANPGTWITVARMVPV